jgi:hypothetical protein
MAKKKITVEQIDAHMARWQSKLKRAVNTIERLQRMRKRLLKKAVAAPAPRLTKAEALAEPVLREIAGMPKPRPEAVLAPPVEIDTGIPDFLRRSTDNAAIEQITQELAETKRKKAAGRIAKMKAKQSGAMRKMPLTGKAALAAIRSADKP